MARNYKKKPPIAPEKKVVREIQARSNIDSYKANILDRIFKLEEKKRKRLTEALSIAIEEDKMEYDQLNEKYKNELKDHNELIDMANRILQGDTNAYKKAVEELEPLSEISEIGSE